jgi:AbrB family looped-hinge helix DNA binding protein
MPFRKVNRNYRISIPKEVRQKAGIDRDDTVVEEYGEDEGAVWYPHPDEEGEKPGLMERNSE